VRAVSASAAYAVGEKGTILEYDGHAWSAIHSDPTEFHDAI